LLAGDMFVKSQTLSGAIKKIEHIQNDFSLTGDNW
jgi:hypothetical protein